MSAPLVVIRPDAFAFEAVLEMTRAGIHHLPVVEDGRLVGVVSSHDFLLLQSAHPMGLAREIGRASSRAALRDLAGRVTALVRDLVADGGSPYDVGQLVAELNDRLVRRVLALALAGEAPGPPVPYCWLVFGSEGRREQTLRTDQDHGLVYADPPADLPGARAYFLRLGAEVTRGLVEVGFPPCPGEIMASNPRWCRPVSEWVALFRGWMEETTPEHVLAGAIFFDLRPLAGALAVGDELAGVVRRDAPGQALFLRRLAEDVATSRLPLSFLGRLSVERQGPRRGTVDLKAAGTLQLVGAGRLHALALGLAETNTVDRFRQAGARGLYPAAEVRDIKFGLE
jgi:CBS domain-containing protein